MNQTTGVKVTHTKVWKDSSVLSSLKFKNTTNYEINLHPKTNHMHWKEMS